VSSEVKRYDAVHLRYEDSNIRYGEGCEVEVVTASDHEREVQRAIAAGIRMQDKCAALEAECERLRSQVSALQSDANSWQSGYDKGREDGAKAAEGWKAQHARDSAELRKLCAERDALRAENERLNAQFNECARLFVDATEQACKAQRERDELRAELEAARGLLGQRIPCDVMLPPASRIKRGCTLRTVLASIKLREDFAPNKRVFTSAPAPEVQAEQGERQEAVAEYQQLSRYGNWDRVDKAVYDLGKLGDTPEKFRALYTTPQPCPDVRALLSADDVRDACANAVSVFTEVTNADQCREVAEYMREVLLAKIAKQQAK